MVSPSCRAVLAKKWRALRSADGNGFQDILTINSDDLPSDELAAREIDVSKFIVLTLTDADTTGGNLGIRVY